MSGLAKAFLVSALVAVASPAAAVEIRVSATIVRPIWERSGVRDRQMRSVLRWVPASHQLVHVYQPRRPIGKIYCGSAWTDSNGSFNEDFECGSNLPDQLTWKFSRRAPAVSRWAASIASDLTWK